MFSGIVGYHLGEETCNEYRASVQLEKAYEQIEQLENELNIVSKQYK